MSDLASFLITTGRTLSQMALYSPEHPTVKGAIEEAHRSLTSMLKEKPEVLLVLQEGKILVNGQVPQAVSEASLRPFVVFFNNFNLHSLSFQAGIAPNEMVPFFQLAYRKDLKKAKTDVGAFLTQNHAPHIKVNQVKYARIGEDQEVGGKGQGQGQQEGDKEKSFYKEVQNLPLDQFLTKLINKSVSGMDERQLLYKKVVGLVRKEIEKAVEYHTRQLREEKTVVTNERQRTEGVVESVADGVVVVDESGNVLMMNPAAENIYGVKLGSCVGKPLWEGVKQEQMVSLAKDMTVPKDKPIVKEVELKGSQETRKTVRASSATVQDPNGRVVGMISVLSDVTKQRELTRMQNEFLANVTHDLRAPIHALKLAVEAILEKAAGPVTKEQEKMLSLANRNVDRLSRLINDILDFSQIEAGRLEIRAEIIQLSPVLKDAVASFDAWSKTRQIQLKYEQKGDLGLVYADPDRILQVINNLISNAVKFTKPGGDVILRAYNKEDENGRRLQIEVEDSGKGISETDQQRIFGRFVQLENKEKLDVRGTGLGLSICLALVEAHKGQLAVESPISMEKQGSLFMFSLPIVDRIPKAKTTTTKQEVVTKSSQPKKQGFWSRLFSKFRLFAALCLLLPALADARPYSGRVRRVLSPEKIQLQNGTVVRFLGLDFPKKGEPYYAESMAATRSWVERKEVQFRYGLQERDAKGVWQAYIHVDGFFVNLELVKNGQALVSRLFNEKKILGELIGAERQARQKKRGMWKDSVIDPYPVRVKENLKLPWISDEEQKKGIKK